MYRKLLVGVDGSNASLKAVESAGRLAAEHGGRVTLCYVVPPAPVFVDAAALSLADFDARAQQDARESLARARAKLPPGVAADERLLSGSAASSLVDEARDGDYDLVVVGSHGRTGLERFLLGSVAARVVTHAPLPVLVVR